MSITGRFRQVLDQAGYTDSEATEANVRACFQDYVDSGAITGVEDGEIANLSIDAVCRALERYCKR